MKIRMLANAADENRILEAGKVYNLPADVAGVLVDEVGYTNDGEGGKPRQVRVKFAERADDVPNHKVTRLTRFPDPEDTPETELDEADE